MTKQDWIIIGLSVQLTLTGLGLTKLAYQLGFAQGQVQTLTHWDETGDGVCMADNPPHKGQCYEDIKQETSRKAKEHSDNGNKKK